MEIMETTSNISNIANNFIPVMNGVLQGVGILIALLSILYTYVLKEDSELFNRTGGIAGALIFLSTLICHYITNYDIFAQDNNKKVFVMKMLTGCLFLLLFSKREETKKKEEKDGEQI